jgi:DNA-binding response OmpR family regulator
MRIVIVEDEKALADILRDEFRERGLDADIASDGEAALALIRKTRPELVLLDLLLPKKDGFAVLEELKADPNLLATQVIVLSNLAQDEELKKALMLGAKDYFVKAQHPLKEIVDKVYHHALVPAV